jgi:hypothetical protein
MGSTAYLVDKSYIRTALGSLGPRKSLLSQRSLRGGRCRPGNAKLKAILDDRINNPDSYFVFCKRNVGCGFGLRRTSVRLIPMINTPCRVEKEQSPHGCILDRDAELIFP